MSFLIFVRLQEDIIQVDLYELNNIIKVLYKQMENNQVRLTLARSHFSHPFAVLGQWEPVGTNHQFLNEWISATMVTILFAIPFYFMVSSILYLTYNKFLKQKFTPKRQQVRYQKQTFYHDIKWSVLNIIGQAPLISLIKMGYPLYSKVQYQFHFNSLTFVYLMMHIVYDEFFTYWAHRLLHHPKIYRYLHCFHHKSKAVTPFTGFAFHPLDAFLQALPVFTSCYFIPININIVLAHGIITSLWAFSIHDNVNMVPFKGVLYAGSHSIHHFPWGENYNYGKFTSVCDRLYGTYCDPEGITGYGFVGNKSWLALMKKINYLLVKILPDNGLKSVSKIRDLYAKKID